MQFTPEMCAAAEKRKKCHGDVVNTPEVLVVRIVISSMSVPICSCFHARRANCSKITYLKSIIL